MRFAAICLLFLCGAVSISKGNNAEYFMGMVKQLNSSPALGLYSPQDKVEILDVTNFKAKLYNQPHAWYIEFYNSWCGHCQNFAPIWKDFAARVHGWNSVIKIGAIDCAQEQNTGICREFEILGYPMMRFFSVNFKEAPKAFGEVLDRGATSQQLIDIIIKKLHSEKAAGHGNFNWPAFGAQMITTLADVWIYEPSSTEIVFLIIQQQDSLVGSEIQLDIINIKNVKVLCVHSKSPIIPFLNPSSQTSVFAVDRSLKSKLVSVKHFKEGIIEDMYSYMNKENIKMLNIETTDLPKNEQIKVLNYIDPIIKKMTGNTVFQADLEAALRYTLMHEIVSIKMIEGSSLLALKDYLQILYKHFPSKGNTEAFLSDLNDVVSKIDSSLSGERLSNIIIELETKHGPVFHTNLQWLGCRGSTDNYRGFTCGLWTMFHAMTVSESASNDRKVLPVMLDYVKHFFGCSECSKHFQSMVAQHPFQSDSILWLWSAHNRVNARLSGSKTEDPYYPKRQFPYSEDCPQCSEDGKWIEANVLSYLKTIYKIDNISLLGAFMASELKYSRSNSPGFNATILTLLYIYCGASLVFIIRLFFTKKIYKKKPYFLGKV